MAPVRSRLRWVVSVGLLTAGYYSAARLGLSLGSLKGNIAPIWPPTGLAVAALLLGGRRLWPGVAIGALLVNGLSSVPFVAAFGMAAGNTLEAVVAVTLLTHARGFRPGLDRLRAVALFVVLAVVAATTISATIGVTSLWLGSVVDGAGFATAWRVWWVGDAVGCLVLVPVALVLFGPLRASGRPVRRLELVLLLALVAAATEFAVRSATGYPYLIFPLVVVIAIRHRQVGAALVGLVVAVFGIVGTSSGEGRFALRGPTEGLWLMDTYFVVVALTALVLAAIVSERDAGQEDLQRANDELDERVRERVAAFNAEREAHLEAQRIAQMGSWAFDVRTHELTWSAGLYDLLVLDPMLVEPSHQLFLAHVHPDDQSMFRAALDRNLGRGEPYEFDHRLVQADGSVLSIHAAGRGVRNESGELIRLIGTVQDVSKQRRADLKFQGLLESAPDAMVVVDTAGVIRLINRRTEVVFGWTRAELIGQPVEILIPHRFGPVHSGLRDGYFAAPHLGRMAGVAELAARRKDGTEFPADIGLSPLESEEGLLVSASIRDVTARKGAEEALSHQAMHDGLTGLPNRTLLQDRLAQQLARAQRTHARVAVLFLDIDRFKIINDGRGHSVGDELLKTLARRLEQTVRRGDTVARFGGDEFVILTEDADLDALGRRLSAAVSEPILVSDTTKLTVSVSIGIAVAGPSADPESLLRDADAAMYKAKEQGRDRVVTFDAAMRAGAMERLALENDLRLALAHDELTVHYQPVVNLTSGQVTGVEALMRWTHPRRGNVPPVEVIPIAEETGLIVPLGAAILRAACAQVASWHESYPELGHLCLSVNFSPRQLLSPGLLATVSDALLSNGLRPESLCVEITESVLFDDAHASGQVLRELKELGVRIAVDDFGTGYSSLTYLKQFPVDILKIDKSFVDGLCDSRIVGTDRAIVAGVIDLAHAFGLTTIAEGVETADQLASLQVLGCELGQGFHLAHPMPGEETGRWIVAELARTASPIPRAIPGPRAGISRVLIVEDDSSVRRLLNLLLHDEPDFSVVAEAADGREAIALARHHQPDLVLLDLAMPGIGGLEALPRILAVAPNVKVVVMSGLERQDIGSAVLDAGAIGFFGKDRDPAELVGYLKAELADPTRAAAGR